MFSKKFLASVYLAVICASGASAAPWALESKHATHRRHEVQGRALVVESYHPPTSFDTFGAGVEHQLTRRADATAEESAAAFVSERLGLSADAFKVRSVGENDISKTVYIKQAHKGIVVANAGANVALNTANKVTAFGSSFIKSAKFADSTPKISAEDAIKAAESTLGGKYNDHPASLEYLAREDGTAALVRVVQVQNDATDEWYETFVDAHTGKVLSVTDFVAKAIYRVVPITSQDPEDGFSNLANPQDTTASPLGWHNDGTTTYTSTTGNNVIAYKSATTGVTTESSSGQYVYTFASGSAPTVAANLNAARVNAFYVANTVHDIAYRYGFTEKTYNFQQSNRAQGGAQADRVKISVQDSGGTNNANFATPADGQSGQMRMYLWTYTSPQRDGALENDIVVHEYTHGITNRLTGGGTGRCLQTTEAGGLGEGWSDAFAEWTEVKSATLPDFTLGSYVTQNTKGIRAYPYSTSATTNPYRYSTVKTKNEVHAIGEVWANLLHNVHAQLLAAKGFDATAPTNPASTSGNAVWLHLFMDALQLQPCNPTFLTARDAWIQADANRYAGANKCTLWKAFASRGFGTGAANYVDSTTVPSGC